MATKATPKAVTLTVIGKRRDLSFKEQKAIALMQRGKAVEQLIWPVERAHYGVDSEGETEHAEIRKANRWDAVGACQDMMALLVRLAVAGYEIHVELESGVICTGDKETRVFSNVAAPWLLQDICENADTVDVPADSEDPRDFEGWRPGASA